MNRDQFFGPNPLGIVVRLVLFSIVVGIVMSALGISPADLPRWLAIIGQRIYDLGFGAVRDLFGYFLIGAVVVVPIWLLSRLFGGRGDKPKT
jgi:Family of unknown function (DUF6460)